MSPFGGQVKQSPCKHELLCLCCCTKIVNIFLCCSEGQQHVWWWKHPKVCACAHKHRLFRVYLHQGSRNLLNTECLFFMYVCAQRETATYCYFTIRAYSLVFPANGRMCRSFGFIWDQNTYKKKTTKSIETQKNLDYCPIPFGIFLSRLITRFISSPPNQTCLWVWHRKCFFWSP